MSKFKSVMKVVSRFVDDNLPTILSGFALVGLGASVFTAIKATPKAMVEIDEARDKKLFMSTDEELEKIGAKRVEEEPEGGYLKLGYDSMNKIERKDGSTEVILYNQKDVLTFWERVISYGKIYWPCALTTLATGGCIIASNIVSKKRYLGLAALAATQAKNFDEYHEKVKELFGEKKAEQVRKEIIKDRGMDCPRDIEARYQPGQLYPLEFCGHYWLGTQHEVEKAFDRWNRGGLNEAMKVVDGEAELYLEDLICELGLNIPDMWAFRHTTWNVQHGSVDPKFEPWETANGVPGFSIVPSRPPLENGGYSWRNITR